ncbi:hypothetical protein [Streptomyces sp. NBC_01187]|uniref:hypothetical protein n=1 Tax=Streptomyces sp. NBC_01187 TaxID=2903766 RepID=UPI00386A75A6|nr:hypothetical protein OG220_11770 [Streptomyces sp. NBC_01187]
MTHSVGTEIEATAQWLEAHAAAGAATVLRRTARQRDQAQQRLAAALPRTRRLTLAWASARRRARTRTSEVAALTRQVHDLHAQWSPHDAPATNGRDVLRENALMRTELARCQTLVERAGWMPDAEPRRLWRWREGWWELAYRKRNIKDGFHDSGWYLWGPADTYFGKWVAALKADAHVEADRLITKHFATVTEAPR